MPSRKRFGELWPWDGGGRAGPLALIDGVERLRDLPAKADGDHLVRAGAVDDAEELQHLSVGIQFEHVDEPPLLDQEPDDDRSLLADDARRGEREVEALDARRAAGEDRVDPGESPRASVTFAPDRRSGANAFSSMARSMLR